jgi:hypothetical protein
MASSNLAMFKFEFCASTMKMASSAHQILCVDYEDSKGVEQAKKEAIEGRIFFK